MDFTFTTLQGKHGSENRSYLRSHQLQFSRANKPYNFSFQNITLGESRKIHHEMSLSPSVSSKLSGKSRVSDC